MYRFLLVLFMTVFFTGCDIQTIYFKITDVKSTWFTPVQKVMLAKSAEAVGYDHGYDADYFLDYLQRTDRDGKTVKKNMAEFIAVLDSSRRDEVLGLYERIFSLMVLTEEKLFRYKKVADWKSSTYLEKYLLPPLKEYHAMLETYVVKKFTDYAAGIETRKKEMTRRVRADERKRRDAETKSSPHCC